MTSLRNNSKPLMRTQLFVVGMGLLRALFVYGLAVIGLVTIAFVVLAYGWDGKPPTVRLAGPEDED